MCRPTRDKALTGASVILVTPSRAHGGADELATTTVTEGPCGEPSRLQKNVLDRRRWATRDELRIAIITWIERTYHRRRPKPDSVA